MKTLSYDALLMSGIPREVARDKVRAAIDSGAGLLGRWLRQKVRSASPDGILFSDLPDAPPTTAGEILTKPPVAVVGSLNADLHLCADTCPAGRDVLTPGRAGRVRQQGANQAAAAAPSAPR
jgi:hypothetical protein